MLDKVLLQLAKSAIIGYFDSTALDKEKLLKQHPFLSKKGASFVTLNLHNNLRGCIGSIIAYRTLYEDIVNNAISSAFKDPRFKPLSINELSDLYLEVSILSETEPIEYNDYNDLKNKIVPKLDGLILEYENYQGTFLPQVWDQLQDVDQFLEHLSYKAGASPNIYNSHPSMYRYRVQKMEGKFDEILSL
jgi:AmmeMemoRadiSam system protein A